MHFLQKKLPTWCFNLNKKVGKWIDEHRDKFALSVQFKVECTKNPAIVLEMKVFFSREDDVYDGTERESEGERIIPPLWSSPVNLYVVFVPKRR